MELTYAKRTGWYIESTDAQHYVTNSAGRFLPVNGTRIYHSKCELVAQLSQLGYMVYHSELWR